MSRMSQQNWLLLIVKSLTHNQQSKHYQLLIKNHAIDNKLTIENQFSHNYQYVYRLWPCKPAQRELIKIQMVQVIRDNGREIFVKRGEASPLVQYSLEGEKFQFYASNQEKSMLVLKFKTETESKIQNQTSKDRLHLINNDISLDLQNNRFESEKYSKYLEYSDKVVRDLDAKELQNQHQDFREQEKVYFSRIMNEDVKLRQERKEKQKNTPYYLTNSKYLNKSLEIPLASQQKKRDKTEIGSSLTNLGESIRKRRELYICSKASEDMGNKPPESPILTIIKTQEGNETIKKGVGKDPEQTRTQDNECQTDRPEIKGPNRQRVRSECHSTSQPFCPVQSIVESEVGIGSKKNEMNLKEESISKYPNDYLILSRRYGTIRRKKERKMDASEDPVQKIENPSRERSITHISRNSKIFPTREKYYDIQMFNFRASLYRSKGKCFRKLVLVFEDSRYATDNVQCLHLMVEWNQRFGIRNCRGSSYLYCRLYCTIEDEEIEEGQATVNIEELAEFPSNKYKVFFRFEDLAIGFMEFEFTKRDCTLLLSQEAFVHSNQSHLPKIKKQRLPKGISPKNILSSEEIRKSSKLKSVPKQQNLQKSKEKRRPPQLRPIDQKLLIMDRRNSKTGKSELGGLTKVQERKLKLKSKLK